MTTGFDVIRARRKAKETRSPIRVTLECNLKGGYFRDGGGDWGCAELHYFMVYPSGDIWVRNKSRHYVPCTTLGPVQRGWIRAAARRAVAWIK